MNVRHLLNPWKRVAELEHAIREAEEYLRAHEGVGLDYSFRMCGQGDHESVKVIEEVLGKP